jgi:spore coat polysaccharide biosynthesis protein SpsF
MSKHIFIQSRLDSKRLPGKILYRICGKSILEIIVEKAKKIEQIDKIVLITGEKSKNEKLIDEANRLGLEVFTGNNENILDRIFKASIKYNSDIIIRLTGDNPLIDFNIINDGLDLFQNNNFDFLNIDKKTYALGLNFEIIRQSMLASYWSTYFDSYPNENTFFNSFIPIDLENYKHQKFRISKLVCPENLSHIRFTLDYEEDFLLISKIFNELYPKNPFFVLDDILKFIKKNPHLLEINKKYISNNIS